MIVFFLKMIYIVQSNCLQSTVNFYLWCGASIDLHIKLKCLRFYATFEDVLQESSLKNTLGSIIDNGVLIFSVWLPSFPVSRTAWKCSSEMTCLLTHA